ncbi:MucBP domain-containing protein [Lactobacillus mulieris]|uniref:MucBP domain-containing protein n=1 Tax=Lactobacillus mulieris TaxID=2508708 RepID=A0AAW5WXT9_9LACO|nr:MucBP domain-containing protein [Lactobacillus mulieris]MCZ3622340.1 MucBP domain-containing protein [Lactobacillus mulieris]MCZ3622960.1 MucBP domain-containing protein [Lactobacillus mulieris]MCZ3636347.1 MucBP domain-containing protein [Lactobacillus mulieris]MCZ3690211.1 MucBP domain-containing protein [Lactobacillus mulieris]MCZ3696050.1 MucBP domain-containing protein [Lactobacillus mulieris]
MGNDGTYGTNNNDMNVDINLTSVNAGDTYIVKIPKSSTYYNGPSNYGIDSSIGTVQESSDEDNWILTYTIASAEQKLDLSFTLPASVNVRKVTDNRNIPISDVGTFTRQISILGLTSAGKSLGSASASYQTIISPSFSKGTYSKDTGITYTPYADMALANKDITYTVNLNEVVGLSDNNSSPTKKAALAVNYGTTVKVPMPKGFVLDTDATAQKNTQTGASFSQDSDGNVIITIPKGYGDLASDSVSGYSFVGKYVIDQPETTTTITASAPISVEQKVDANGTTIVGTGDTISQTIIGTDESEDGPINIGVPVVSLNPYGYPYGSGQKTYGGKYNNDINLGEYTVSNQNVTLDAKNSKIDISIPDGLNVSSFLVNSTSENNGTATYTVTYTDGTSETATISNLTTTQSQLGNGKSIKSITVSVDDLPASSFLTINIWGNTAETYSDGTKVTGGTSLKSPMNFSAESFKGAGSTASATGTFNIVNTDSIKAKASFGTGNVNNYPGSSYAGFAYFANAGGTTTYIYEPILYYVLPKGLEYANGTANPPQGSPKISTYYVNGQQVVKVDYTGTGQNYDLTYGNTGAIKLASLPDALKGNYIIKGYIYTGTGMTNTAASTDSSLDADFFGGSTTNVYYIGQGTINLVNGSSLTSAGLSSGNLNNGNFSSNGQSDDKGNTSIKFAINIMNSTKSTYNNVVEYANIPSSGKFALTGPVTAPSGTTVYYSKQTTDLNNVTNKSISDTTTWTSDVSNWTAADWSAVKSIALSVPTLNSNTSSGRFIINGQDSQIALDANSSLAMATALTNDNGVASPVPETSSSAPKLTISGTSTVKTALQYTDADGATHTVNLNYTKQYQDNSSTMNYSDFPSAISGFNSEDQATINDLIAKGYSFVPLSDTNNTILNNGGQTWQTDSATAPDGSAAWGQTVKYYFDGDTVVYKLGHQILDITPNGGKSSTDKLPNESGKNYPDGVTNDDLTKTVTRTINIYSPDGKTIVKTITQNVAFKKTAYVDGVTGKITGYSNYSSFDDNNGQYAEQDFDTPAGYSSSVTYQNSNTTDSTSGKVIAESATDSNGNPVDETVDVKFTANPQTITIKYVDDDNNGSQVGSDQTVTGKTDETVTPTYTIPDGYEYVTGKVDSHTMTPNDDTVITVHLSHKHDITTKTINKEITYQTTDGKQVVDPYKTAVTIIQDVDEATNTTIYKVNGETATTADLGSQTVPNAPTGYHLDTTQSIGDYSKTTSYDLASQFSSLTDGQTISANVIYAPDSESVKVRYETADGTTLADSDTLTGDYGTSYSTSAKSISGYSLTTTPTNATGTYSTSNADVVYVYAPDTESVKVRYETADGKTLADSDTLTGDYGTSYSTSAKSISGYTLTATPVNATGTYSTNNDDVVYVYAPDKQVLKLRAYDVQTGSAVEVELPSTLTTEVDGASDGTVDVDNVNTLSEAIKSYLADKGYNFVSSTEVPTKFDTDDSATQYVDLSFNHATTPATEDKTVTRTIIVKNPDGTENTTKQEVTFTRTVTTDNVTGEKTYSNWTTDGSSDWNEFTTPTVAGYTPSQSSVEKVTPSADDSDQTVTIDYSADKQQINIVVTDNSTGQPITVTIPTEVANSSFTGESNSNVPTDVNINVEKIKEYLKSKGYTVPDTVEIPTTFDNTSNGTSDNDTDPQTVTIEVGHNHTTADKTITKTITYKTDDNQSVASDYTQSVTIHQDIDDVTGTSTYSVDDKTLENGTTTLGSQSLPSKTGYYAASVPEGATSDSTVDFNSDNVNVSVVYKQLGKIIPVDESGNPIPGAATPTYNNSDDPTKVGDTSTPTVPGYTASKTTIPSSDITNPGEDTKVIYTANPKTTNIVFKDQDNNNEVVKTVPVNGHTSETVNVDSSKTTIPDGYELVDKAGNVIPTTITFTGSDSTTPDIVVYLKHKNVEVTPDSPKNTTDVLPDNPTMNYPDGVSETDLNKTITRTIVEVDPVTKEEKTVATQTVHYTRTATVDEVNDNVTYTDWTTTDKWASYTPTAKSGYTPSQVSVEEATPAVTDGDTTVTITYTANPTNTTVVFVDDNDDGKTVKTVTVNGTTGGTTPLSSDDQKIPDGYELVPGNTVPTEITFNNDGSQTTDTTIHLKHKTTTVTPENPAQPGDKLPDNPDKKYPDGVDTTKTITRTINVHKPDGSTETTTQRVTFTRTVAVDEVTGKVTSSTPWTSTNPDYPEYTVPSIDGYTPSQSTVEKLTPKATDNDSTVDVTYTGNVQTIKVVVTDKTTGKEVTVDVPTTFNGTSDQKVGTDVTDGVEKITDYLKQKGYSVPDKIDIPTSFDHSQNNDSKTDDHSQVINITVDHTYSSSTETKTITRTIKVITPDGKTTETKQTVTYSRTVTTDNVTGESTPSDWTTTDKWNGYTVPIIAGYTPSQTDIEEKTPSVDDKNETITITYVKDAIPKPSDNKRDGDNPNSSSDSVPNKPAESKNTTPIDEKSYSKSSSSRYQAAKLRNANRLPQTGNNNEAATAAGLAAVTVSGLMSLLSTKKKKRH